MPTLTLVLGVLAAVAVLNALRPVRWTPLLLPFFFWAWLTNELAPQLLVLVVLLGVYPKPVIDTINPAVQRTMCETRSTDVAASVPASGEGADTGTPFRSCTGVSAAIGGDK